MDKSDHRHVWGMMPPGVWLALGVVCFGAWVIATMFQIQTSEALVSGGAHVVLNKPNWSVLIQPLAFVQGQLSVEQAKAFFWGWFIELLYIIFAVGIERAQATLHVKRAGVAHSDSTAKASKTRANIFYSGMAVVLGIDVISNYLYGQVMGDAQFLGISLGQAGFALLLAFATCFFGVIAAVFIEAGLHEMKN